MNGGVVEVTNSFGIYHKTTQDEVRGGTGERESLHSEPSARNTHPLTSLFSRASPTDPQILIRRQTLYDMLDLHKRVDPKETLVGWYSTWKDDRGSAAGIDERAGAASASSAAHIDQFSLVVQDFFADAAAGRVPLHMLVDVSLKTPHVRVFAYQPVHNNIIKK